MTNSNLIFRDKDTNSALERVQEKLGPDAYILEIKNVGNFVEITASLEPPKPKVKHDQDPKALLKMARQELDTLISPQSPIPVDATKSDLLDIKDTNEIAPYPEHNLFLDSDESLVAQKETGGRFSSVGIEDQPKSSEKQKNRTQIGDKNFLNQGNLSYGDLITLGFGNKFLKEELGIFEFEGSVSREKLINQLVNNLIDAKAGDLLKQGNTIILLGPPGSGKSTLLGKLMHLRGAQNSSKPEISHITREKLFEADRLRFYSKLFNFNFKRHKSISREMFNGKSDLVEVDWSESAKFLKFYRDFSGEISQMRPILTLSGETNSGTLAELLKVSSGLHKAIITKCDYGRVSVKNLMQLYENNIKLSAVSGDRNINDLIKFSDTEMMTGFCDYCIFG